MAQKKIVALCGSIRSKSSNLSILKEIGKLMPPDIAYEIYDGLGSLPHFNPDINLETEHQAVNHFRTKIREADGILICTPEYAFGVPGVLKNALDWTVSSCEFNDKNIALITASSVGKKGHEALLHTLDALASKYTADQLLLISFIRSKMNAAGEIIDKETREAVNRLVHIFTQVVLYEN